MTGGHFRVAVILISSGDRVVATKRVGPEEPLAGKRKGRFDAESLGLKPWEIYSLGFITTVPNMLLIGILQVETSTREDASIPTSLGPSQSFVLR